MKKNKKPKVPAAYTAGITGSKKVRLQAVTRKISSLYRAGKTVPQRLIEEKLKLGKKKTTKSKRS